MDILFPFLQKSKRNIVRLYGLPETQNKLKQQGLPVVKSVVLLIFSDFCLLHFLKYRSCILSFGRQQNFTLFFNR